VATNYWLFQFGPELDRWGIEAVLTSRPTKTPAPPLDPAVSFPVEPALPDSIGRVVFYGMTNLVFLLHPDQRTSLMDAIDQLNLGPTADLKHVTVTRDHGGTVRTLDASNRSDDLRLMDGDRVKIPERRVLF
jgi:hypothetical protein